MLSYLSPSTRLLSTGGQEKPSFWDSLSHVEYGLFPHGAVYIPWEAAIGHAPKVTLWRHLSEAARWTKGRVGFWWWYLRWVPLLSDHDSRSCQQLLSATTLGKVFTWVEKPPNSLEQGWPYAFPQSQRGCCCTLWTRLSTPIAILSGAIMFKSRTKCSFNKHLQLFICMCDCLCDTRGMWQQDTWTNYSALASSRCPGAHFPLLVCIVCSLVKDKGQFKFFMCVETKGTLWWLCLVLFLSATSALWQASLCLPVSLSSIVWVRFWHLNFHQHVL